MKKSNSDFENIHDFRDGPTFTASLILYSIFLILFLLFTSLGIWQVKRLKWKTNLINHVNQQRLALPREAPPFTQWNGIRFERNEYQPVYASGTYLNDKEAFVVSVTNEGPGYWLMTPLKTDDQKIIFINRGFIPMDKKNPKTRQCGLLQGRQKVSGLLRMGEKDGILFRKNDFSKKIWYSRQLDAISLSVGLDPNNVAPYFIDADDIANDEGIPRGGLTVIHFRNAHLLYAITWFSLSILVLCSTGYIIFSRRKK